MANTDYIISGGVQGKSRLKVLSETLYPYTRTLLDNLGLSHGCSFLDVGCGGGDVSILASEIVGKTGIVKGIDFDSDIISLANEDKKSLGLKNVSFQVASAYDIDHDGEFDIAYARFLLSHLRSPVEVLEKMKKSVKMGGKVMIEDTHFTGHFCYPECNAFDKYVEYYIEAAINNGHNPNIGPGLFNLFQKVGFSDIGFDVIIPSYNDGPGKWMAYLTLDRIKNTLVEQNIDSEENIKNMLSKLKVFTEDNSSI